MVPPPAVRTKSACPAGASTMPCGPSSAAPELRNVRAADPDQERGELPSLERHRGTRRGHREPECVGRRRTSVKPAGRTYGSAAGRAAHLRALVRGERAPHRGW